MSVKKKKRNSALEPKNLIAMAIAATAVILVAVVMRLILPGAERKESFDEKAWRSAIIESGEENINKTQTMADSGLNDVYNEEVVSTAANAQPEAEVKPSTEGETQRRGFIPPVSGAVTTDYSGEDLVYSKTMDDWRTHNGIDFAATDGEEVVVAADGTIEEIVDSGMMGTTVIVLHSGGVRTIYSNLADSVPVGVGDSVKQGGTIGKVGGTAAAEVSEPPHIHFEVSLNEEPVNPHDYLQDMGDNGE